MLEFNPEITGNSNIVSIYGDDNKGKAKKTNDENIAVFGTPNGADNKPKKTSQSDVNPYADDGEKFKKFGENAQLAQSKTIVQTGEVSRAVVKKKFKGELPPAPNPTDYDGYETYLVALGTWQQNCTVTINDSSTKTKPTKVKSKKPAENNSKVPDKLPDDTKSKKPVEPEEPVRIGNVDKAARDVLEASEGLGTDDRLFFESITLPDETESDQSDYRLRKELNKTEAKALDNEIRRQTGGKKSLLMLIKEEYRLDGFHRDNQAMTRLYKIYKGYDLTDKAGMTGVPVDENNPYLPKKPNLNINS